MSAALHINNTIPLTLSVFVISSNKEWSLSESGQPPRDNELGRDNDLGLTHLKSLVELKTEPTLNQGN